MYDDQNVFGNYYDKYNSTNLVEKMIMNNFFRSLESFLRRLNPKNILEVGCGEGVMSNHLYEFYGSKVPIQGVDVSAEIIKKAAAAYKEITFSAQSVYNLDFEDNTFDLVVAFETLEHLENPSKAIQEIRRVGNKNFIFSVPWEPVWRIMNIMRLKYIRSYGNSPGHIQHWTKRDFIDMISEFIVPVKVKMPIPFIQVFSEGKTK